MKNRLKKLITLTIIATLANMGITFAQQYKSNTFRPVKSSDVSIITIPTGTKFKIRMENSVNSLNSSPGEPFIATLTDDIKADDSVLLPQGTTIRGRVKYLKRSFYLSRGGALNLNFEIIETTIGRQLPISARISDMKNLTPTGIINMKGGYLNALSNNLDNSVNLLTNITGYSVKKGLSFAKGYPVILTAPLGATAGTAIGSYVFLKDSVVDIFKKGQDAKLNTGDIMDITLIQPIDVPLN